MYALSIVALLAAGASAAALTPRDYTAPGYSLTSTGNATINAPSNCNSYITQVGHAPGTYDPSLCATDCNNQRHQESPKGLRCHFFSSYQLFDNGVLQSQVCALYTRSWNPRYATTTSYTIGQDIYTIQNAYSGSFAANPGHRRCPGNPRHPPKGPLTSCPGGYQYIVPYDRTLYKVCIDTNFKIRNTQVVGDIQDDRFCAVECDNQSGCNQAVYNAGTQQCFLKGNNTLTRSNWRYDTGFETLELVPEGIISADCIAPLYSIVQGNVTYDVCPSAVYVQPASNIWYSIPNEYACAAQCQSASDCQKFSYNWNTETCYDVGNPTGAAANLSTQYSAGAYWAVQS